MWLTAVQGSTPLCPALSTALWQGQAKCIHPSSHIKQHTQHCSVKCSRGGHLWVCSQEVREVHLNSRSGWETLGRAQNQTRAEKFGPNSSSGWSGTQMFRFKINCYDQIKKLLHVKIGIIHFFNINSQCLLPCISNLPWPSLFAVTV